MELEQKDQTINSFFAQIDTFSNVSSEGEGGLVQWMKKDSGSNVSFTFKMTDRFHDFQAIDSLVEIKLDSLKSDSIFAMISDRSNLAVNKPFLRNNRFPSSQTSHSDFFTDSTMNSHVFFPGKEMKVLEIIKIDDEADKPYFGIVQAEVHWSKVLSRIMPQILFSVFLMLSVFLAYWLIVRSLQKERQLGVIRNDFMSNISHELKTPVSTIGVALEALSNFDAADKPELRKEYIDISRLEVERLGLLVDKALNISLYEQGKFVYDRQNIDLDQEIARVLKTLKVQLDNQNVELHYNARGSKFFINVDRTHMINVVYNLIENGIKYSENEVEIDINLIERTDHIELNIADKGRGIAPEFQDQVFEKFFRVPQGHKHNVKGHGLGLSYVKEVVESLGGQIKLKSGIEAGSTFIIKLPKADG